MFKLSFHFDREVSGLEQLNGALAGLPLSELSIERCDGYLATKTSFDSNGSTTAVTKEYGFDDVAFECQQSPDEALIYQIEAATFEKGKITGSYHDIWCAEHPDRIMRVLREVSFDTAEVFIVLHHQRVKD